MSPVWRIVPIYPLKRIITEPGQWLASKNVTSISVSFYLILNILNNIEKKFTFGPNIF